MFVYNVECLKIFVSYKLDVINYNVACFYSGVLLQIG
jgi:hypothetical protein